MPTYDYKCSCNDEIVEIKRSFNDPIIDINCTKCGSVMRRHYSSIGVQFKGKGFYSTDYGKKK